jgi:hypothetical protein
MLRVIRLNITIGNTTVDLVTTVPVTGNKFNLANNPVSVINMEPNTTKCKSDLGPNRSR